MLDLSIVIVNYRSWSKLENCLHSLHPEKQKTKKIIVVDNNSGDNILDRFIEKFPWVDWVKNDINAGFAAGCNLGAEKVTTQWMLFLNPDTRLQRDCLPTLISYCDQHPDFHLITIKQTDEKGNNTHPYGVFPNAWNSNGLVRSLQRFLLLPDQTKKALSSNKIGFPHWISGSFVLLRKEHFELLGGWDEKFWMYFEDVDLCKRAADIGLSRILLNQWECLHYHGVSSRGDNKTKILTKAEVIKSHHKYIEKNFVGKNRKLAHRWLMIQKITEFTVLGAFDKTKKAMLKKLKPFWHQMFSSTDI